MAVPAEIQGMYTAWLRYGRLPWSNLFQPTIEMCRNGFLVDYSLAQSIDDMELQIRNTPSLKYAIDHHLVKPVIHSVFGVR